MSAVAFTCNQPVGNRSPTFSRRLRSAPMAVVSSFLIAIASGCSAGTEAKPETRMKKLTHEEALKWIQDHQAWRLARKTKPIWARLVTPEEVGKEFLTADHVRQLAKEGFWLCVGIAGEPWFQSLEKIKDKYEDRGEEKRRFTFDAAERSYHVFQPRSEVQNWVAQIKGPDIEGFFIKPNYDPTRPLYSPAGGYVVTNRVPDPYKGNPDDVWLVQEGLFQSTYEVVP